jgi:DNA-binding response OmpR family regulator
LWIQAVKGLVYFWKFFGKKLETVNGNKDGAYRFQYAFGEFEIDPVERTCTRLGTPVPLTAKAFDVLLAFVENPNRLLGKDELMERVGHD